MNSYNECKEIVELDLDPIKVKLMHKESGEGWTLEQASAVETEYRRYLYLMKKFPNELAAPSMDVDTFWHYHILDTMKYARDCEEVFGYFLHHFPYVGLRGEDDLVAHHQAGERMAELYEETFGEKYPASLIEADSTGDGTTAFSVRAAPAFSRDTTAFSVRPGPTVARNTTAFSVRSAPPAIRAGTAYSLRTTTAYSLRTTTAYSLRPGALLTSKGTNQDETGLPAHSGDAAFSMSTGATVTGRDIDSNSFFLTRPRIPAQATAN
jgi:hypothetical protein